VNYTIYGEYWMDIKILEDKNNVLLNRRELDFTVKYEGPTPSRSDIRNKLAAMLNAPFELLIIQKVDTEYGMQEARGYAKLYADEVRMKEIEHEYILKRNPAPAEEKAEGEEEAAAEE
jgi:small subunit ribosomal protein S24e